MRLRAVDRHLPALPGARRQPHFLQHQRHQAGRHLLARGDYDIILGPVIQRRGVLAPVDQLVGLAGHGRDDDRDLISSIELAFDMPGGIADALDIGDGGAAEFHHQTGHGGPEALRSQFRFGPGQKVALAPCAGRV
jgi:hypothetical protein